MVDVKYQLGVTCNNPARLHPLLVAAKGLVSGVLVEHAKCRVLGKLLARPPSFVFADAAGAGGCGRSPSLCCLLGQQLLVVIGAGSSMRSRRAKRARNYDGVLAAAVLQLLRSLYFLHKYIAMIGDVWI
jgi:hypothetical protein